MRLFSRIFFLCMVALMVHSCSWLDRQTNKLLGRRSKRKPVQSSVSKAQYDELLRKYERLKNKYEGKGDQKVVSNDNVSSNLLNDLETTSSPAQKTTAKNNNIETVDVFADSGLTSKKPKINVDPSPKAVMVSKNYSFEETNKEVTEYQQGVAYLAKGKNDLALRIFQKLEKSGLIQIRVRARLQIGHLLYKQKEYDLAMQVYEDIIDNYSFSGVVLQALDKLVSCSEKLNLSAKRDKYNSVLKDIFGV